MIDTLRVRTELRTPPSGRSVILGIIRCERITDFDVPALLSDLSGEIATYGPRLALDMSGVELMGSSGLSLLLSLKKTCESGGGKLAIFGLNDDLTGMLKVTSLLRMFRVETSEAAALAAVDDR